MADAPLDSGDFNVTTSTWDGQVVLRLTGELDAGTAPRLRKELDALGDRRANTLVLDLAALTFIDSSGLHELVVALKRQREAGGDLMLREPSLSTRRVLEIVGLSQVLTIE